MSRITRNAARCRKCDQVVVDGGREYLRRGGDLDGVVMEAVAEKALRRGQG